MRLLLVEDEPAVARHLLAGLREEGYAVDLAPTLKIAARLETEVEYDLVVLDLMMPDGSGRDLLSAWKRHGLSCPVLVLTALDALDDKVRGLDAGADDYLTKPFQFEELLARLRSLLRRRHAPSVVTLRWGQLCLDRTARQVTYGGRAVDLTPREFALLEYIMLHPGKVLDRCTLAEHAWDHGYEARSNVVDVLVGRLRRKLEAAGSPDPIRAVRALGYALRASLDGAA